MGEGPDQEELQAGDLLLGEAICVDHPERVFPRIEPRDLCDGGAGLIDAVAVEHLVHRGVADPSVLERQRVDGGSDQVHRGLGPGADVLLGGEHQRVVRRDLVREEVPYRKVRHRQVQMV